MHPRSPDAIMDEAVRCPCTQGGSPLCPRCECLVQLALARDVWRYEQVTGEKWEVVMSRRETDYTVVRRQRISGLRGLGYTLLGYAACAYAVLHYACRVLPRCAWLHWTGQLPRTPSDPHTWPSHDKESKF